MDPVEFQCGTCKFAGEFCSGSGPSGPEDGVHCLSEAHAKLMDEQTHTDTNMEEFRAYGFLDLYRLEGMAEKSHRCPSWEPKGEIKDQRR